MSEWINEEAEEPKFLSCVPICIDSDLVNGRIK